MLVISDVHLAVDALRRVVNTGEELLILGDLVNLTDYRTGEGAIADVLGLSFARRSADSRAAGDFEGMRALWEEAASSGADRLRAEIGSAVAAQYEMVSEAMLGGSGFVIHGNVDRPELLESALPDGFQYVHGRKIEIGGAAFGFVGGGLETPIHAAGETTEDEMRRILVSDELVAVQVNDEIVPFLGKQELLDEKLGRCWNGGKRNELAAPGETCWRDLLRRHVFLVRRRTAQPLGIHALLK